MRTGLMAFGMVVASVVAVPAMAQEQAPDFEADAAMASSAQFFASVTPAGSAPGGRTLYLGRDAKGEAILVGISAGAPNAEVAARDEVVALVWIRSGGKPPTAADGTLAGQLGRSLFIVDGPRAATMWEIGRRGGTMQYRKSGKKASDWQGWSTER
ncbi:hypothetical protein [Sphingomonas sp. G-3-2-10]|uniref:hypothetical protein n=1 Tax=Sphingomonas sp. G-3-2-10 TaxID=2728838 RepID=UPI00146B7A28|nr:hypothetical protein [Sphingomonas sp. G-3-2-10]NML07246.1 hypothetical protein [Sphingomonas sp. G-3-2-10]